MTLTGLGFIIIAITCIGISEFGIGLAAAVTAGFFWIYGLIRSLNGK